MELGLITFADMQPEEVPGRGINAHQRIRDLLEEIQLADHEIHRIVWDKSSSCHKERSWFIVLLATV